MISEKETDLTDRDIAILTAALRYFDEEFSPSGPAAIGQELPGLGVIPAEIAALRVQLGQSSIRFADPNQLHDSPNQLNHAVPVIVAIPTGSDALE